MIVFKLRVDDQGSPVIDMFGKKAKALEITLGKTTGLLTKAFQGVAMYSGISAFISAMGNANKEMDTFYLNIRKIEQVGGVSGKGLGQINEQMRKLALSTEFTHSQISAAGVTLSRMGINTAETMGKILPNAMNLATVAGEDLTLSAEGLAQIFTIFNIKGEDTTKATNKIGVALNKTALDLKGYIEAMQYAGAAAGATKVPFDDITAAIAFLSQRAIVGSRAGTTMKNILISLVKPSSDAGKALKESGLAANDLVGMFRLLNEKGVGIDKIVKMFGMWATPGALGLQQGVKSFASLRDEIIKGNSDIAEQARIIREENLPAYQQMMNAVTNLGMEFGNALGFKKGDIWKRLKDELIKFAGYIKDNKDQIKQLGDSLKTIGSVGISILVPMLKFAVDHFKEISIVGSVVFGVQAAKNLGKYALLIRAIGTEAKLVSISMGLMGGPIGLATIAAGLLLDKFININKEANKISNTLSSNRETPQYFEEVKKQLDAIEKLTPLGKNAFGQVTDIAGSRARNAISNESLRMNYMYGAGVDYTDPKQLKMILDNKAFKDKMNKPFVGPLLPAGWTDNIAGNPPSDTSGGIGTKKPKTIEELLKIGVFKELGSKLDQGEPTTYLNNVWSQLFGLTSKAGKKKKDLGIRTIVDEAITEGQGDTTLFDTTFIDEAMKTGFGRAKRPKGTKAIDRLQEDLAYQAEVGPSTWYSPKYKSARDEKKAEDFDAKMAAITMVASASFSAVNATTDMIIELDDRKHKQIMKNIEEEQTALDRRYKMEMAAAGDNAFRKSMAEQKYQAKKEALDKKMEAQQKEIAKNQLIRDKIQASTTFALAVLGVMKSSAWLGPIAAISSMLTLTAAAMPLVTAVTAKSYRSGGLVEGNGNGSSDSEWARVSRGERILSTGELSKMGGNERIQQMLDRNTSSSNRNVNITIGSVYGSKQFVREMISSMKEELSR